MQKPLTQEEMEFLLSPEISNQMPIVFKNSTQLDIMNLYCAECDTKLFTPNY
jgi:hypothetical protein